MLYSALCYASYVVGTKGLRDVFVCVLYAERAIKAQSQRMVVSHK